MQNRQPTLANVKPTTDISQCKTGNRQWKTEQGAAAFD
jgi:hypothetical protein